MLNKQDTHDLSLIWILTIGLAPAGCPWRRVDAIVRIQTMSATSSVGRMSEK